MSLMKKILRIVKTCSFEFKPANSRLIKSTTEIIVAKTDKHEFYVGLDTSLGPYGRYSFEGNKY
jgi:hypothetical protein